MPRIEVWNRKSAVFLRLSIIQILIINCTYFYTVSRRNVDSIKMRPNGSMCRDGGAFTTNVFFHLFRRYRCHRNSCLQTSYPSCLYYPQLPLMYTLHFCAYFSFHSFSISFYFSLNQSLVLYHLLSFLIFLPFIHSPFLSTLHLFTLCLHSVSHSDFVNRYLIDIPSFLLSSPALLLWWNSTEKAVACAQFLARKRCTL